MRQVVTTVYVSQDTKEWIVKVKIDWRNIKRIETNIWFWVDSLKKGCLDGETYFTDERGNHVCIPNDNDVTNCEPSRSLFMI